MDFESISLDTLSDAKYLIGHACVTQACPPHAVRMRFPPDSAQDAMGTFQEQTSVETLALRSFVSIPSLREGTAWGQPEDNSGFPGTTPGTTWGQIGGQPRDNPGPAWGQSGTTQRLPGNNPGTTRGQPGDNLGQPGTSQHVMSCHVVWSCLGWGGLGWGGLVWSDLVWCDVM